MKLSTINRMHDAVWLAEWLMRYDNNAETAFAEILAQIAEGESLVDFCDAHAIRYGFLLAWIRADPSREHRYMMAMNDRKAFDAELGRGAILETVTQTPIDPPTHGERLKAAGMLTGADKQVGGGNGVTINIVRFADEPVQIPKGYVIDGNNTTQ